MGILLDSLPSGPKEGPMTGPMIQPTIARPLFSIGTVSAIVPAPRVRGQLAAMPEKRRKTIKAFKLGASAQAMLKIRNNKLQMLYIMVRPYSSDSGAIIRGPKQYPRRKTEVTNAPSISSVE